MKTRQQTNKIILHCSATPEGRDVTVATIKKWHLGRGWSDIGYHYVIYLDGQVRRGRHPHMAGAHTKGHNHDSIGVCYIGGLDSNMKPKDTMTQAQYTAFVGLVKTLREFYQENLPIHGHNEFANKACPSFEVADKFCGL